MSENVVGEAVLRRHIGRRFTALRTGAGLTQAQAAAGIQKGLSTLARMEEGNLGVRFRDVDVRAMLDLYRAGPEDREQLLAQTASIREGKTRQWWQDSAVPEWFSLYVVLEDSARTIREYESELVPGLLQTRDYIEQLARTPAGLLDDAEVEQRVRIRLERQGLLTREHAPRLDVVLNEAVIRRPVGGPAVMAAQLEHLATTSRADGITVRILPYSAGVHGGMAGSAFILLDFPTSSSGEELEPPIAYVDTLTGSMHLNKPEEVRSYELAWQDLEDKALSPDESRDLIISALEGLQQ